MSFKGIGKSIHPMGAPNRRPTPPPHRLDEFPAGYSSAGCSPAGPASALPAERQYATTRSRRSIRMSRPAFSLTTDLRPLSFHVSHGWGAPQYADCWTCAVLSCRNRPPVSHVPYRPCRSGKAATAGWLPPGSGAAGAVAPRPGGTRTQVPVLPGRRAAGTP